MNENKDEPNVKKSFKDFESCLGKKLYIMNENKGRAKDFSGKKGTISITCYEEKPNPIHPSFGPVMCFYIINYRKSWYHGRGWTEGTNFNIETSKYDNGFTLTDNVWFDILTLNKTNPTELVLRIPPNFFIFNPKDLIEFNNKWDNKRHNQNDIDNPIDYGFPAALMYKVIAYQGWEHYNL